MIIIISSIILVGTMNFANGVKASADAICSESSLRLWGQNCYGWRVTLYNNSNFHLSYVSRYNDNVFIAASGISAHSFDSTIWGWNTSSGLFGEKEPRNMSVAYKTNELNDDDWYRFIDIRSNNPNNLFPTCGVTQYDGPFDLYKNRHDGVGCRFAEGTSREPIQVEFTNLEEDGPWKK